MKHEEVAKKEKAQSNLKNGHQNDLKKLKDEHERKVKEKEDQVKKLKE